MEEEQRRHEPARGRIVVVDIATARGGLANEFQHESQKGTQRISQTNRQGHVFHAFGAMRLVGRIKRNVPIHRGC